MIVNHVSFVRDGDGPSVCVVERREVPDPKPAPRVREIDRGYMSNWTANAAAYIAMHHTGIHWCGVCGEEVEGGEGECRGCRSFIEWPEPGYEDFGVGF